MHRTAVRKTPDRAATEVGEGAVLTPDVRPRRSLESLSQGVEALNLW